MNELHGKLLHMRMLLQNMMKFNQVESTCQNQMQPIADTYTYKAKKVSIKLIAIVTVVLLLLTFTTFSSDLKRANKNDKVNDEFQWTMKHYDDNEAYPGYEQDPTIFTSILIEDFAPIVVLILILAAGYISAISFINKARQKEINQKNSEIMQQNQYKNQINQKHLIEISGIQKEKKLLYMELAKNLKEWFPKDYSYLSAVDYFINLVENHMTDNIQDAVKLYLDEVRYNATNGKLDQIINGIRVMINNQEIIISRQDEMIRQQIFANCINLLTYSKISDIASNSNTIYVEKR